MREKKFCKTRSPSNMFKNVLQVQLAEYQSCTMTTPLICHICLLLTLLNHQIFTTLFTGKARENCNREGLYHHRVRECSGKMQTEIFSNRNEMIQLGREKKNDK